MSEERVCAVCGDPARPPNDICASCAEDIGAKLVPSPPRAARTEDDAMPLWMRKKEAREEAAKKVAPPPERPKNVVPLREGDGEDPVLRMTHPQVLKKYANEYHRKFVHQMMAQKTPPIRQLEEMLGGGSYFLGELETVARLVVDLFHVQAAGVAVAAEWVVMQSGYPPAQRHEAVNELIRMWLLEAEHRVMDVRGKSSEGGEEKTCAKTEAPPPPKTPA